MKCSVRRCLGSPCSHVTTQSSRLCKGGSLRDHISQHLFSFAQFSRPRLSDREDLTFMLELAWPDYLGNERAIRAYCVTLFLIKSTAESRDVPIESHLVRILSAFLRLVLFFFCAQTTLPTRPSDRKRHGRAFFLAIKHHLQDDGIWE